MPEVKKVNAGVASGVAGSFLKAMDISIALFFFAKLAFGVSLRMGNSTVADPDSKMLAQGRVLFCSSATDLSNPTLAEIKAHGHEAFAADGESARLFLPSVDIVLLDVTSCTHDSLTMVRELTASMGAHSHLARLLCFSSISRNPRFVLEIEKCGARYVRVGSLAMLLEALELAMAEIKELRTKRPRFQIIHRFSQGECAPGEEIVAVRCDSGSNLWQLPLNLAQRLTFDFLALHRHIGLDSIQIASGLNGGWFYKNHAANSGIRQFKKIRPLAVKVTVQRIRDVMGSTFTRAGLKFDPYDVLRSIPMEGSRKVLYKLTADVVWSHPNERL